MTNIKSHACFRLVPTSTTSDDRKRPLRTLLQKACAFSKPTTKIWMKVDPYYQRQKSITLDYPVCQKSSCGYSRGLIGDAAWGVKWQWSSGKWQLLSVFQCFRSLLLPNQFRDKAIGGSGGSRILNQGGNRQTRGALPSRPLPSPPHLPFPPLPLEVVPLKSS